MTYSPAPSVRCSGVDRGPARFSRAVDRESLVSALSKKIARGDRFVRTAKNTFALRSPD